MPKEEVCGRTPKRYIQEERARALCDLAEATAMVMGPHRLVTVAAKRATRTGRCEHIACFFWHLDHLAEADQIRISGKRRAIFIQRAAEQRAVPGTQDVNGARRPGSGLTRVT